MQEAGWLYWYKISRFMLCLSIDKCHVGGFLQQAGYVRTDWM